MSPAARALAVCSAVKPRCARNRDWRARSLKSAAAAGPKRFIFARLARSSQSGSEGPTYPRAVSASMPRCSSSLRILSGPCPRSTRWRVNCSLNRLSERSRLRSRSSRTSATRAASKPRASSLRASSKRECSRRARRSWALARASSRASLRLRLPPLPALRFSSRGAARGSGCRWPGLRPCAASGTRARCRGPGRCGRRRSCTRRRTSPRSCS